MAIKSYNKSFEEKLKRELSYKFKKLDDLRDKTSKKIKSYKLYLYILILLYIFSAFNFFYINGLINLKPTLIIIVVSSLLLIFFGQLFITKFSNSDAVYSNIKKEIFSAAFKVSNLNMQYDPQNGFTKTQFIGSLIPNYSFNHFYSEDSIEGEINGMKIKIGEVDSFYESRSSYDDDRVSNSHTVFKGLFLESELKNQMEGYLVIRLKDNSVVSQFRDLAKIIKGNVKKLNLYNELNDDFINKNFDIFCNNADLAKKYLSIEFIVFLKQLIITNQLIHFSFVGNMFYAAYPLKENLLEFNYNKSLNEISGIEKDISHYISLLKFVDYIH